MMNRSHLRGTGLTCLLTISLGVIFQTANAATLFYSGTNEFSSRGVWKSEDKVVTRVSDGLRALGVAINSDGFVYSNVYGDIQNDVRYYDPELANQSGTKFNVGGPTLGSLGLTFGADGDLYISDGTSNNIHRYNGTTGLYAGGLSGLPSGYDVPNQITSDASNILFVRVRDNNLFASKILRFNGTTGVFIDEFLTNSSISAIDLTIGPDQQLYVSDSISKSILKFDSQTGDFLSVAATGMFSLPRALDFDSNGYLYVSDQLAHGDDLIHKIDISSNTVLETFSSGIPQLEDLQVSIVPVPAALPLFASALGLMGFVGWKRRRKSA